MSTSTTVSLGGSFIGLAILAWNLARWWKRGGGGGGYEGGGSRDWKALIPLASGLILGMLCGECAGGLFGTSAGWVRSASNTIGDTAIKKGTGAATPQLARATSHVLTSGGALVLLLLVVVIAALWKSVGKKQRKQIAAGIISGCNLGVAEGVASAVGVLAPLVNTVGDKLVGLI